MSIPFLNCLRFVDGRILRLWNCEMSGQVPVCMSHSSANIFVKFLPGICKKNSLTEWMSAFYFDGFLCISSGSDLPGWVRHKKQCVHVGCKRIRFFVPSTGPLAKTAKRATAVPACLPARQSPISCCLCQQNLSTRLRLLHTRSVLFAFFSWVDFGHALLSSLSLLRFFHLMNCTSSRNHPPPSPLGRSWFESGHILSPALVAKKRVSGRAHSVVSEKTEKWCNNNNNNNFIHTLSKVKRGEMWM